MTERVPAMADPRTPQELRDRTEQSWQAWVTAIEGIPDDRLGDAAVGHWTVKDLLGHVAFWEDWVIGHCQRILADEPEPAMEEDAVNQGQVEASKSASPAAQKRFRDEAHARLMAFLRTIPDGEAKFPRLVEALEWETYKHYDEHTDQVRAWRAAQGL
jgi:hypothetical protein